MTHNDFYLPQVLEQLQSDENGDLARPMVSFLYQVQIRAGARANSSAENSMRSKVATVLNDSNASGGVVARRRTTTPPVAFAAQGSDRR